MTDHLIRPPDELLEQWNAQLSRIQTPRAGYQDPAAVSRATFCLFTQIARWGANQQLEKSSEWLNENLDWAEGYGWAHCLTSPSSQPGHGCLIIDKGKIINDLKKAMRPQQQEES